MRHPTQGDIAIDFELWGEYVDPNATMTREEFDTLSVEDKIEMQKEMFGEEGEEKEDEEE